MGPRPGDDVASSTERMRSRLTRAVKAPLSSVTEITETSPPPRKQSPPVAPKRASLRDRIARRPSLTQNRPAFGAPPAAPEVAPNALMRRASLAPVARTRPPVPSRDRKPALAPRRSFSSFSMARHPDFTADTESDYSSNLSTNTQVTSVCESDATPEPPVDRERRMVRRPTTAAVRKQAIAPARVQQQQQSPPARTIHIQVQPQKSQKSFSDAEETVVAEYKEEIKRLKAEVSELRDAQSSTGPSLEDALDRLSLVTLEREQARETRERERQSYESLQREVEQRCKTITGLKAQLEDRERTLDELVARFDARAKDLDAARGRAEAVERNLDEVKAILAHREDRILELGSERDDAVREKDKLLDDNDDLRDEADRLDKEKEGLLRAKDDAENEKNEATREKDEVLKERDELTTENGALSKEKELWELEREKLTLEVESLNTTKTELEAKCEDLMKEIGTRLAARSAAEDHLVERVAALEIIKDSLDMQLAKLTTQTAKDEVEIGGLKETNASLETALEKETARATALESEKAALEESVKGLEEAKAGLESAKAELEGVRDTLEGDKATLEADKTALEARAGELEASIAELKTTIECLEVEKAGQEENITTLTSERDALKTESSAQDAELKELRDGGAATKADLDALRASEEAAKAALAALQEAETALKADIENLRGENATLQTDLAAAREAPAGSTLQQENDDLKLKNEDLQTQLTRATADLDEQSTKASAATTKLEEESKRLEEESKKMEDEFKKLAEESKKLEAEAGASQVGELKARNEELAAQLAAATSRVGDLGVAHQAELSALRAQIRSLSRVSSRSKSPKKKKDELVVVRNPNDRSSL